MSLKKVVVVGAGASARLVVKTIRSNKEEGCKDKVHITVIQANKFASLPYYQPLVLTKKVTFANNSTFAEIDGADETIYGTAVSCSDGKLSVQLLDDNDDSEGGNISTVPFDVLVAATGISFPTLTETPGQSREERQEEIDRVSDAVTSGRHIVIAGGGSTGVEFAANILESLPEQTRKGKVTLICTTDRLLADQPPYYGERCKQVLEELGGNIIYNDRVVSHSETTLAATGNDGQPLILELKTGKELVCHAYIPAYSRGANTSWLAVAPTSAGNGDKNMPIPSNVLNDKGRIVVNDYLQSSVYDKLYAVGATSSREEPSLFMNVESQAKTVASNILKPNSIKQSSGVDHAVYQVVGNDAFATMIPESTPLPGPCATLCCQWCGYPCNLLCPCFCLAVLFGPVDAMICGWCCGRPEGKGLANTLKNSREMNLMAKNANYGVIGEEMDRK